MLRIPWLTSTVFGVPWLTILIVVAVVVFFVWLFGGRKPKNGIEPEQNGDEK